jgi:hypothetical protein
MPDSRDHPRGYWKVIENRRKFFDDFAITRQFNPLDAERWYSIYYNDIVKAVS